MAKFCGYSTIWVQEDWKLDEGDVFDDDDDILLKRGMYGTDNKIRWTDRKSKTRQLTFDNDC